MRLSHLFGGVCWLFGGIAGWNMTDNPGFALVCIFLLLVNGVAAGIAESEERMTPRTRKGK